MQRSRLNYSEWIILLLVIGLGTFMRWYLLEDRALHHDESLHGLYGKYFFTNPSTKFYRYNPLLHGPFLYNLLPAIYKFLGISKFSIRAVSSFLGTLFIFAPFLFRRYLSRTTLLILISYIALSPTMIYWSRYIRHDYLVIFFMILMLLGMTLKKQSLRMIVIIPALFLQLCVKENFFITVALITGFLIYESIIHFFNQDLGKTSFNKIIRYPQRFPVHFATGFLLAIFFYIYFFSSGFRYAHGILDGIYRKSLSYWVHQHDIERIKGPFSFQTLVLCWYELFFVFALITHLIWFYIRRSWFYRIPFFISLLSALICHLVFQDDNLANNSFWNFFKLKINLDFYLLFSIPLHAVLVTTHYLLEQKKILAFWGYFFFASYFTYSFVGEKVPWLALYPMISGMVFFVFYFQSRQFPLDLSLKRFYYPTITLVVIAFALTFHTAVLTNFTNSGSPTELISQVHTEEEFEQTILGIKKEISYGTKKFYCHNIAIWPTSWFLYGEKNFYYGNQPRNLDHFDFIIAEHNNYELSLELMNSHIIKRVPFRSWWVPNYKKMTWINFFKYTLKHEPWNPTGTLRVTFYVKRPNHGRLSAPR